MPPISALVAQNPSLDFALRNPTEASDKGPGFAEMLSNSIENVSQLLNTANEKETALVTGQSENLHDAMIAVEKAETAMKMLVQFRNKAIDAYQDILKMPL